MWLKRPTHHRAVHEFRDAAESGDAERLSALLDPEVAVVVDSGDRQHPAIRVVRGAYEAVALLMHGMAARSGVVIEERAVNAQAGLMLNRGDEAVAAMTVDFTGGLISVVWIRLQPVQLRHWNEV
ncbi:hypothetical protein [Agromyces laixinhei]|uniref:hypothetical protein n=1 Tax=Agromyces laixinhei TaxID=2585717 RepID=UPI00111608FC|nr:hypothetical protein [Agromyces laixinhei]